MYASSIWYGYNRTKIIRLIMDLIIVQIFQFQQAYFILDELLLAGELQESSKKNILRSISQQDSLEGMEVSAD